MPVMFEAVFDTRMILRAAERAGLEPAALVADAGLDPALLARPLERIPYALHNRLLDHAQRCANDDAFALHMGEVSFRTELDLIGITVSSTPTLREAHRAAYQVLALFCNYLKPELIETPQVTRNVLMPLDNDLEAFARNIEYHYALFANALRQMGGRNVELLEVRFQHPRRAELAEYERIFRAPVSFSQPRNELVYPGGMLDLACVTADPELRSVLQSHIEELVVPLPASQRMADLVRNAILNREPQERTGLQQIARRLGMSPRALQYKLREEGTTYQELLTSVRRELARTLLSDRGMALGELAYRLGFSEASAFNRAFRGWYGMSPTAYRARH